MGRDNDVAVFSVRTFWHRYGDNGQARSDFQRRISVAWRVARMLFALERGNKAYWDSCSLQLSVFQPRSGIDNRRYRPRRNYNYVRRGWLRYYDCWRLPLQQKK